MRSLIKQFPTVSFFILAYALSWAYWVPLLLAGARVAPGSSTTHFPGLLGPAIAAILVQYACEGTNGLRALWRRMVLVSRPQASFWAYSLSPVGFLAAALGLMLVLGMAIPGAADFARFSGLPELGLPLVVLLVFVVGGYGEEVGWRGFALERMQLRFGPLRGALLLAALWAGWHLPAFGVIQTYREMTVPMIIGGFLLGLTCGSIVLARVSNRTSGSVFAAAIWHATYNLTAATSAGGGFISAFTTSCVTVWAIVLVVQELRRSVDRSLLAAIPSLPVAEPVPAGGSKNERSFGSMIKRRRRRHRATS
jgi:membrane protease YdiL (CAAX protease family)